MHYYVYDTIKLRLARSGGVHARQLIKGFSPTRTHPSTRRHRHRHRHRQPPLHTHTRTHTVPLSWSCMRACRSTAVSASVTGMTCCTCVTCFTCFSYWYGMLYTHMCPLLLLRQRFSYCYDLLYLRLDSF